MIAAPSLQLVQALLQASQFVKAEQLLNRCCERDPTNKQAWFLLGAARDRLGQPEAALAAFQQAARLDPDNIQAYNAQGAILAQLGRLSEALAIYERALARHPDNPQLLTHAGIVRERMADLDAALGHYDAALAVDPYVSGRADEPRRAAAQVK